MLSSCIPGFVYHALHRQAASYPIQRLAQDVMSKGSVSVCMGSPQPHGVIIKVEPQKAFKLAEGTALPRHPWNDRLKFKTHKLFRTPYEDLMKPL